MGNKMGNNSVDEQRMNARLADAALMSNRYFRIRMSNLYFRIAMGGDDAWVAAWEFVTLNMELRGYEHMTTPKGEPLDIVSVLRALAFVASAPEHASLYYCATHAADEIERLRMTNDEREAIAYAVAALQSAGNYEKSAKDALRKLLERTA